MANTKQGIYYQDNYSSVADVPSDMKKMAESIDTELTTVEKEISEIDEEQSSQNIFIATLQRRLNEKDNQIAELKAENEDLKADLSNSQIHGQSSGEYVHLSDSAKMNCEIGILGNSRQETREGYNLLSNNNLVLSNSNKTIQSNKRLSVISNTTYSIVSTISFTDILVNGFSDNTNYETLSITKEQRGTHYYYKFTTKSNTTQIYFYAVSSNAYDDVNKFINATELMLIKGTEEKEYESYGAMPSIDYPSEIECVSSTNVKVCNKNLLQVTETANPTVAYSKIARGNATLKKGKTYTISFDTNNNGGKVYMQGNEFGFYKDFSCNGQRQTYTFTMTIDKTLQNNFILQSKIATEVAYDIKNIQIEESTTATDYIPHEEQNYPVDMQEPFRAINDIRDCFVLKEDGKWYERHKISRKIFDGSENFSSGVNGKNSFYLTLKEAWKKEEIITVISSHLQGVAYSDRAIDKENIIYINCGIPTAQIYIRNTNFTTLEEFKTYLAEQYDAGTPIYVDYIAETPTDIECTEQQTQQLNALQKAKTYKNITNITTDTIAVLDVDYKRDLETIINNQNQAIIALGGV